MNVCPHCKKTGISFFAKHRAKQYAPAVCKDCGESSYLDKQPSIFVEYLLIYIFLFSFMYMAYSGVIWPFILGVLVIVYFEIKSLENANLVKISKEDVKQANIFGNLFLIFILLLIFAVFMIYGR